jgi:Transglycosylase-like domain
MFRVMAAALVLLAPHHDHRWKMVMPYNAKLERMAWCESRGRWYIATGNGYYGGLQFDLRTWHSVGGNGYPHQNSKLEQKYRAVKLIKRRGYSPWPVCGGR